MKTLEERVEELIARIQGNGVKVKVWDIQELESGLRIADIYIDDWVIHGGLISGDCVVSAIDGKIKLTLIDDFNHQLTVAKI